MSISAHRKDFQMFEERIAKGVKYLDKDLGPNWPERISLEELDLVDCYYCVIGQLYGEFSDRFDPVEALPYGFDIVIGDDGKFKYDILTQEWKAKIAQLQAQRKS